MQTDRDKQRILDGLEGASSQTGGGFNRQQISDLLSGLGKRVFLLHNVHDGHPILFQTRWALSYLAGPLTRTQIKQLMQSRKDAVTTGSSSQADGPTQGRPSYGDIPLPTPQQSAEMAAAPAPTPELTQPPVLPPDVPQVYIPLRQAVAEGQLTYRPELLAVAKVHFVDSRKGLSASEELVLLASLDNIAFGIAWDEMEELAIDPNELTENPPVMGRHAEVPSEATQGKSYRSWEKTLADYLYRTRRYTLWACRDLDAISEPGESERDFRIRLVDRAREVRDEQVDKLRAKYRSKLATLEERVRKAEIRVEKEEDEAANAKVQTAISLGATILSAVLGRRAFSTGSLGRATTAARGIGHSSRQVDDVHRAEQDLEAYSERLEDLQRELERDIEGIEDRLNPLSIPMDTITLKPRRTDIRIRTVSLAWAPYGCARGRWGDGSLVSRVLAIGQGLGRTRMSRNHECPEIKWSGGGSNSRPLECHSGALPAELPPRNSWHTGIYYNKERVARNPWHDRWHRYAQPSKPSPANPAQQTHQAVVSQFPPMLVCLSSSGPNII